MILWRAWGAAAYERRTGGMGMNSRTVQHPPPLRGGMDVCVRASPLRALPHGHRHALLAHYLDRSLDQSGSPVNSMGEFLPAAPELRDGQEACSENALQPVGRPGARNRAVNEV